MQALGLSITASRVTKDQARLTASKFRTSNVRGAVVEHGISLPLVHLLVNRGEAPWCGDVLQTTSAPGTHT